MGLLERLVPSRLGVNFRWLVASSWTSNLGDGLMLAAGPLLVASLTDNPFLISLAAFTAWAPQLVLSLAAGVMSDRLNRRRIVLVADASRLPALAALVALIATNRITPVLALVCLTLLACAEVFADNASATLTPMLVARDDLATANARVFSGFIGLNQLAGPPIGAALFAVGAAWPLAGTTLLLVAALLLTSRIVVPRHGRDTTEPDRSVRRDLAEGLRWTVRHAAVRTLILTILIFNVTYGAAWAVLVLYARERLGLGSVGFGLISTITAVGGLLGTGVYGWITRRISLGNLMRVGLVIETFTHLALALTTMPWVAFAIFFVFGAHAFIWGTTSVTIRQRAVPSELYGRVGALNTVGVFGGLVVGSLLGGALASRFGVTAPFWFAFGGSAIFVVLLWRALTHVAHADEQTPAPALAPS